LQAMAFLALDRIFLEELPYKKAGVYLNDLRPADNLSQRLWDNDRHERLRALMGRIDQVNQRFGRETVQCGLFNSDGKWRSRLTMRSPRYTTRWDELPRVRA